MYSILETLHGTRTKQTRVTFRIEGYGYESNNRSMRHQPYFKPFSKLNRISCAPNTEAPPITVFMLAFTGPSVRPSLVLKQSISDADVQWISMHGLTPNHTDKTSDRYDPRYWPLKWIRVPPSKSPNAGTTLVMVGAEKNYMYINIKNPNLTQIIL